MTMPILTRTTPYRYTLYANKCEAYAAMNDALPDLHYVDGYQYIQRDLASEPQPALPSGRVALCWNGRVAVHETVGGALGRHLVTVAWKQEARHAA